MNNDLLTLIEYSTYRDRKRIKWSDWMECLWR